MSRPARALINTAALKHNLNIVRKLSPDCRVMAVIKANGYGHGLLTVATALAHADEYGVASIDEALILRKSGVTSPIVALEGFFSNEEIALFLQHDITAVIHSAWQVEALERSSQNGQMKVWLKLDTGMNRLGIKSADVNSVMERLHRCSLVGDLGLMSHFASADETAADVTSKQLAQFKKATDEYDVPTSIANSAGIVAWPESHGDVVRPGIMLYGSSPIAGTTAADIGLLPVMSVQSELIAINPQKRGDSIGYGGDWSCLEDMPVGVVAFGYGDGYPRHIANGTPVVINDQRVPIVGRVSMDMITVDLRGVEAGVGDTVELWGTNLPIDEVARYADTISYELMCQVTERVTRINHER